jgi:hypothetical protein
MAKKFLTPLGLVGLASDPATGSEGQLYFNTTDDVIRVYANGVWTELSGGGASVYYQAEAPDGAELGALWVDSDSTGTGGTGGGTSGTSLSYWTEDNNGNLLPDLDNVYSVGSSAYRVKDLYLGASSLYLQNPANASANISLSVDLNGNIKINDSKIITESNANDNLNLTNYATLEYAQSASAAAVSYLVDSAPGALDTLNELAAALNDDANFATTVTNSLSEKLSIQSASTTYQTKETLTTISSNYTANLNETVFVNTASTAITVTLPSSPIQGSKIKILDVAANAQNNMITVLGNGYDIGGASAYIINTPDSSVDLIYINSNKGWIVSNEYISITKPVTPTAISATDVGTGRAYNNGAATVSFTPSTSGDIADTYTAISTPGSYTTTGSSSPLVVTGLQTGISYTFKVYATNSAGSSSESDASSSITATTVPQAPTIGAATYGFEKVDVSFTPGNTGGKAISSYTVTRSGGGTTSGATSPISVGSLTAGTGYTFTITATNENGTSNSSAQSNSATPFTASGGAITTSGSYRYHSFTSSSTFTLTGNSTTINYLVVAGGGGGGSGGGDWSPGGGGAGGLLMSQTSVGANSYSITIGAGGGVGGNGNSSSAIGITSTGGGLGSVAGGANPNSPGSGGSGGGGGGVNSSTGGGSGISGQGYNGGNGTGSGDGSSRRGGGGGGAGGAGGSITPGPGLDVSSFYNQAPNTTYLSGGGAGKYPFSTNATGGIGGGGNSGGGNNSGTGGTVNTGGGGGASPSGTSGGSGIVVLRYGI